MFFLMVSPILISSVLADDPPPPMGPGSGTGGTGGPTGQPIGGGAPIDGGLSILLAMGAIYGANKVYQLRK